MRFVVPYDGEITLELDDETRELWVIEVEYQEVD